MNPDTLLYRQVHPEHVIPGRETVSSRVFTPEDREANAISTYNGDMISADDAVEHYLGLGLQSAGVVGLTVDMFEQRGMTAEHDGIDFEEHVTVYYPNNISRNQIRRQAQALAKLATWYARA